MKETEYLNEQILKEVLLYAYKLEAENINAKNLIEEIKNQILQAMKKE